MNQEVSKKEIILACIVLAFLLFFSLLFIGWLTNGYFGWYDRINCHHEAHSMGFKSDYEFHWVGNNTCTYVLPNGKRILSTKYREME